MVAIHTTHPNEERQGAIRRVTQQILGASSEFRLVCVSVVGMIPRAPDEEGGTDHQFEHLIRLRHWVEPLQLPPERLSLHVIESLSPAAALLEMARRIHADLIILGAPGAAERSLAWWRSVASSVTANAPCSVHVVRIPERAGGDALETTFSPDDLPQ